MYDATFVPFTLLRWDRTTGRTERWTGSGWAPVPGLGLIHAVYSGGLGYDEITREEAAAIVSRR